MVNRKKSLFELLGDLWSMDLTTEDVLHYCTLMGFARCVVEPQIKPVFAQWDAKYAAHCAAEEACLTEQDRAQFNGYALN